MLFERNVFNTPPLNGSTGPTKCGQLDQQLIEQFFSDGYLVVPRFFDIEKDLEPCKKAIENMVDQVAQNLHKAGKIKDLHEDLDVFHRLTQINKDFPGATVLMHKIGTLPDEMMKLWINDKLLNVVEQLIGPDIGGHPVWNVRPKAPHVSNHDVPWHQDNAYLDSTVENVLQITAWIPLTDSNAQNGCLEVLKGGHRSGKLAPHLGCWADSWYVYMDDEKIESTLGVSLNRDNVVLPVPYGGMLLFSNTLPHRSLANESDSIRWSLDFRWQNPHQSYGFHGVKDGVTFRTVEQKSMKQEDWEKFNSVDRQKTGKEEDEFDTTINPFYMYRWPLMHENRHTAKLHTSK